MKADDSIDIMIVFILERNENNNDESD